MTFTPTTSQCLLVAMAMLITINGARCQEDFSYEFDASGLASIRTNLDNIEGGVSGQNNGQGNTGGGISGQNNGLGNVIMNSGDIDIDELRAQPPRSNPDLNRQNFEFDPASLGFNNIRPPPRASPIPEDTAVDLSALNFVNRREQIQPHLQSLSEFNVPVGTNLVPQIEIQQRQNSQIQSDPTAPPAPDALTPPPAPSAPAAPPAPPAPAAQSARRIITPAASSRQRQGQTGRRCGNRQCRNRKNQQGSNKIRNGSGSAGNKNRNRSRSFGNKNGRQASRGRKVQ